MVSTSYVGRFAPSPTGPLHFGSLIVAVASYLEAKIHHGTWLVRIEDIDKPREIAGAADDILRTLINFGFEWQNEVVYQCQCKVLYAQALEKLKQKHLIYPCTCTRKEISDSTNALGIDGFVYPKTCLNHPIKQNSPVAWRIKVNDSAISFFDGIQGNIQQSISQDIGDFVLVRADGLFAYQLTVIVDDANQGVTHVVRGADLLDSTPRQIYLQQQLNLITPQYAHVPVATNLAGEKLSKQTLAKPLSINNACKQLWQALEFLGQNPPFYLQKTNLKTLWDWAFMHWSPSKIPRQRAIVCNQP